MTGREPRIDIIRGCAIVVILINHLTQVVEEAGLRDGMIPTPTRYGYSTAAELFVIMSGYMVGLVYLSRPTPALAILRRARTLWLYDLALLAIVVPISLAMTPRELAFWQLDRLFADPVAGVARFAALLWAPRLLDILQLYIQLMLLAPVAIWVQQRAPRVVIPLSIAIYGVAQAMIFARLAADPEAKLGITITLMCWQMMFFVPMALGVARVHERLFAWLDGSWGVFAVLLALFVAAGVARELQREGALAEVFWMTGPYGLGPTRVVHSLLVLLLYASALTLGFAWLRAWPLRIVGAIGRHSLDCFAGGVVATYALGTVWARAAGGYAGYYALALLGVMLTAALAWALEARRLGGRTG